VPAPMGHEDDALEELRACAAAVGAQAVLDVQFRRGEDADRPTVLSGVAVRFCKLEGGDCSVSSELSFQPREKSAGPRRHGGAGGLMRRNSGLEDVVRQAETRRKQDARLARIEG